MKRKARRETNLKFYKTIGGPLSLYCSETWTLKKNDLNQIEAAEMKYFQTVRDCARHDCIRNEYIRKELGIFLISKKPLIN